MPRPIADRGGGRDALAFPGRGTCHFDGPVLMDEFRGTAHMCRAALAARRPCLAVGRRGDRGVDHRGGVLSRDLLDLGGRTADPRCRPRGRNTAGSGRCRRPSCLPPPRCSASWHHRRRPRASHVVRAERLRLVRGGVVRCQRPDVTPVPLEKMRLALGDTPVPRGAAGLWKACAPSE